MSAVLGTGHFVSWDGGCLLIGRATAVTPVHAHYAIQIAFGSQPGIRFRPSDDAEWIDYDGVVIASRQPHGMDASRVPSNAVVFIEPETRAGRALTERFHATHGITALPAAALGEAAPALFSAWTEQRTVGAIAEAADGVVRALTGGVQPSVVSDLTLIFAELMENAAAYSPPHTRVNVNAEATGAGAQVLIVDHGIGMSSERLAATYRLAHPRA